MNPKRFDMLAWRYAPKRTVVRTERLESTSILHTLECGHTVRFAPHCSMNTREANCRECADPLVRERHPDEF